MPEDSGSLTKFAMGYGLESSIAAFPLILTFQEKESQWEPSEV